MSRMKWAMAGVAALSLMASSSATAAQRDVAANKAAIDKVLDAEYPHLDTLYKDIHAHPEIGFQEIKTAAKLASEMRTLGFEVTEHVGRTGIVAILRNGPGPLVLVRTELDALPLQEKTGLPYASVDKQIWEGRETFVDHACGHDIHMASWVGTAKALVALKAKWRGTVMFIGQPAEETVGGARAMLADNLFQRFGKPDYGFGLHVGPAPFGTVSYKSGVSTSNSDSFEIRFLGRGAHGSMPSLSIDPVMMAGRFIVDVQSVAVAEMSAAPSPAINITEGGKAVVNDAALTERTAAVFKAAFGDKVSAQTSPSSASEDYSEFILAGVPSVFFSIGGIDPAKIAAAKGAPMPVNHSPYFAPTPEPTIRTGVEAMTLAVLNVMAR
eukprot:gene11409-11498_t